MLINIKYCNSVTDRIKRIPIQCVKIIIYHLNNFLNKKISELEFKKYIIEWTSFDLTSKCLINVIVKINEACSFLAEIFLIYMIHSLLDKM